MKKSITQINLTDNQKLTTISNKPIQKYFFQKWFSFVLKHSRTASLNGKQCFKYEIAQQLQDLGFHVTY